MIGRCYCMCLGSRVRLILHIPCMSLAHHELESVLMIIFIVFYCSVCATASFHYTQSIINTFGFQKLHSIWITATYKMISLPQSCYHQGFVHISSSSSCCMSVFPKQTCQLSLHRAFLHINSCYMCMALYPRISWVSPHVACNEPRAHV